ncbi:hypothetical protein Pelo_4112 [Pelomyxa schiedti]|nr:hypothetical protein Pelo_4112 [Pelomyxa schiedti]
MRLQCRCLCILVSLSVLLHVVAGSPYYNRDGDSGVRSITAVQRATNNLRVRRLRFLAISWLPLCKLVWRLPEKCRVL